MSAIADSPADKSCEPNGPGTGPMCQLGSGGGRLLKAGANKKVNIEKSRSVRTGSNSEFRGFFILFAYTILFFCRSSTPFDPFGRVGFPIEPVSDGGGGHDNRSAGSLP
ncbi:Hypothetical protein NTJ_06118 [Nesidiocoris tenuis]|uniref:Uncharacterized protein n=1 Tax=Nesidiocoris tenuis TaxID=355587 RepID=A0ABN7AM42_9HEMI|nr:Hypothetical protein NTJ_06118 [Nesidiocoris tenuis]